MPARIHYDDLDAMGILHHPHYATVFDRAIIDHWTSRGYVLAGNDKSPDTFNAVRELVIEYLSPVTRPAVHLVHLWLNHVGRTSTEYGFRLLAPDGGTVHATGRRVVVKLDPGTLRPAPWTDRLHADAMELLRPAPPPHEI